MDFGTFANDFEYEEMIMGDPGVYFVPCNEDTVTYNRYSNSYPLWLMVEEWDANTICLVEVRDDAWDEIEWIDIELPTSVRKSVLERVWEACV